MRSRTRGVATSGPVGARRQSARQLQQDNRRPEPGATWSGCNLGRNPHLLTARYFTLSGGLPHDLTVSSQGSRAPRTPRGDLLRTVGSRSESLRKGFTGHECGATRRDEQSLVRPARGSIKGPSQANPSRDGIRRRPPHDGLFLVARRTAERARAGDDGPATSAPACYRPA